MIDPRQLLEQVLGGNLPGAGRSLQSQLDRQSGSRGFAGGAMAGGLLGMLLGGGRRRGFGGGGIGTAVLGALAMQAYSTYQQRQQGLRSAPPPPANFDSQALPHARPAADGSPFELTLVRAMVGAAKADGHIDAAEQRRLFAEVERLGLDSESKAYVFDLLTGDIDVASLVAAVDTPEQGAELYLAARLAIDPDEPTERAYLDTLAERLRLPAELRVTLDAAPQKATA
ncbi:MAG TPA: tellurite resistance TerB family protein [Gammaproteobacteria bacterium]|nr:tellurite resistance TerB family protein [Gammaproteobacteria bacterium]